MKTKKPKFKIDTIQPMLPRRKDSVFYQGQVAIVSLGTRKVSVETAGEIRVHFEENDCLYTNDMATKEAISRGYTDRKIKNIEFSNANWFTLYEINGEEYTNVDDSVASDYEEAIEMAKQHLIEKSEEESDVDVKKRLTLYVEIRKHMDNADKIKLKPAIVLEYMKKEGCAKRIFEAHYMNTTRTCFSKDQAHSLSIEEITMKSLTEVAEAVKNLAWKKVR